MVVATGAAAAVAAAAVEVAAAVPLVAVPSSISSRSLCGNVGSSKLVLVMVVAEASATVAAPIQSVRRVVGRCCSYVYNTTV